MKSREDLARCFRIGLTGVVLLFVWLSMALSPIGARADGPGTPKGVLVLYWTGKDTPSNVIFDRRIQAVFRSAPAGSIEYYAEYLEADRFPGEGQSLLRSDYLRKKYADKRIDVIIAQSSTSLSFLLKYHNDLFPNVPIVYHTTSRPLPGEQSEGAGMTGVVVDRAYRNTLDVALRLHPMTRQALIITGTPERNRKLEMEVRRELNEFEGRVELTYLSDLPLDELVTQVKSAPSTSIILYVRYTHDVHGKTLDPYEALSIVTQSAKVPVYTSSVSLLGRGSVGGYAATLEDCATRAAEVAVRIVNGARPQDIPMVDVPTVPVFDWRQLKRWGISESRLPAGSDLLYKELTFWDRYKWHVISIGSLFALEAFLILGLLVQRTRRKKVEVALAENAMRLRESQAIAHLGSFHWDVVANTVAWSDELYRIYGLKPGESPITYESYIKQVHPDHREQVRGAVQRALSAREPFKHEYRIVRPTGEPRWIFTNSQPVIDASGTLIALQGICQDITDRKHAEEALRESEERARRTLVEQMLAGIAECDATGRFLLANQRYCDIMGYTEAELRGMRIQDITHTDDLQRTTELYRRLVETGEGYVFEKRYRRKDGSGVWANVNVSAVRNASGGVEKAVGVIIDITDRKRAEREREQSLKQEKAARAAAQAANQSKDEFLAVVSHELRGPLNSILGYARLLRSAAVESPEIKKTVEIIERNGRMQLQLIEDLLDTARIISGKLKLEVRPASLISVITGALDVARPAARAKGIQLTTNLDPGAGQITGDPDRLQQVVWNLLSNAIKFTPRSGRVELRLECLDDHVRITVSDTGKGIEAEFLPFVFDRFSQSDSSSSRRFGGLGLGLSLVKQLVELHGGTVEAASDGPSSGATFTVTLPQRAPQIEIPTTAQPRAVAKCEVRTEDMIPLDQVPSLAGIRALVVDDQEEARMLLKATLCECGAQVTTASSGVEALAILANSMNGERPDVLILDINMPDEDGYKVLKRIRAFESERGVPYPARIPAVALTALGRSEDRLKAFAAGFRMHVAKPVEPAELAVVIASLVERLSVSKSA